MTRACIQGKIEAGKIEAQRGAEALSMLDELEASYRDTLSPDQAALKAGHELADRLKAEAARKKRLTYMKIIATDRIHRQVHAHPGGIVAGALSMLDADLSRKAPWQNVTKLRESIRGQAHAMWHQGLNELEVTGLGWKRQRAKEEDLLRALYGDKNTSPSAREIASKWTEVAEFLRARFNKAGGDIGKLESWLLPQSHDMRKIGEVDVNEWKNFIRPHLDLEKTFTNPAHDLKIRLERPEKIQASIDEIDTEIIDLKGRRSKFKEKEASLLKKIDTAKKSALRNDTSYQVVHSEGEQNLKRFMDHRGKSKKERARENATSLNRLNNKSNAYQNRSSVAETRLKDLSDELDITQKRINEFDGQIDHFSEKKSKHKKTLEQIELENAKGRQIKNPDEILNDIYQTLKTDGLNKLKPGTAMGQGMLANRRADPRVLHFKDADSWLSYQKRFGTDDIFSTLTSHMDRMANDIAWMETFGPNPAHMKQYIVDLAKKEAVNLPAGKEFWNKMQSRFGGIKHFENTWDEVAGTTSSPVNARIASFFSEARALQTGAKLGAAFISSFSDIGTMAITAKMNGLSINKMMANHFKLLVSSGARDEAVQLGLVADGMAQVMGSSHRYAGEMMGTGMLSRVADSVMRASLLKPWTEAAQWAFGKEFLGMLARKSSKTFDELDDSLKATFKTYGIEADQWNIMRKADLFDGKGAKFMNPMAIARLDIPRASEVAESLQRMVLTERDYAVITSHARIKAVMNQGTHRGTWGGEAMRSVFQFKNFPATYMALHFTRMAQQGSLKGKASYAAAVMAATTAFGMVSLQGKQVKDGKDLRDVTSWKTWNEAMLQGGGAGIIGDFLFSDQNRFGGSPYGTALGPLAGTAEEIAKLTIGNMQEAAKGEDTHIGSEAIKLIKGNTPFLSLWYARLGIERTFIDQLTLMSDPKAHQRWNKIAKKARKEYGQDYWWKPGATLPQRTPEMKERR